MADSKLTFNSIRNKIRSSVYQSRLGNSANQLETQQALTTLLNDYRRIFHVPIDKKKTNQKQPSTSYSPQIATTFLGLNTTVFYPIRPQDRHQHVQLPTGVKSTNRNRRPHKNGKKNGGKRTTNKKP